MDIKQWSTVADENADSPPDGFPEGQPPSSVNDAMRELMAAVRKFYDSVEWRDLGDTPSYISGTSFSVPNDRTVDYHVGRRIKAIVGGVPVYATIATSTFSSPNTIITLTVDSTQLSPSLSAVELGFADTGNPIEIRGVKNALTAATNHTITGSWTINGGWTFGTIQTFNNAIRLQWRDSQAIARDALNLNASNVLTLGGDAGVLGADYRIASGSHVFYLSGSESIRVISTGIRLPNNFKVHFLDSGDVERPALQWDSTDKVFLFGTSEVVLNAYSTTGKMRFYTGNFGIDSQLQFSVHHNGVVVGDGTVQGGTMGAGTINATGLFVNGVAVSTSAGSSPASQAEMEAAVANDKMVTPANAKWHPGAAKAWVRFDGTNGNIIASHNVSGVTRNGVGNYTITFSTPFSSVNAYCPFALTRHGFTRTPRFFASSSSQCEIFTNSVSDTPADATEVAAVFFGDE